MPADQQEVAGDMPTTNSRDEEFMLEAARNVIRMYNASEADKIGSLKYYGALVTAVAALAGGLYRFGESEARDFTIITILLWIVYLIGTAILRKLVAIRVNNVTLSVELGNIYRFFIDRHVELKRYVGKAFSLWHSATPRINVFGSDFMTFIIVLVINTAAAFAACWSTVEAIRLHDAMNSDALIYDLLRYGGMTIAIVGNGVLFWYFRRLADIAPDRHAQRAKGD